MSDIYVCRRVPATTGAAARAELVPTQTKRKREDPYYVKDRNLEWLLSDKGPQAHARAEPRGGSVISGRYRVERLIARGGMAAVYLAQHIKLNRPMAIKILSPPPEAEDPQSFEDRFELEAKTLSSLDHPNIVILHDFGETEDSRYFLAMEYVDGPRLSDLLRDGPLSVERALHLLLQVCAALRYSHKRGVVHRDLKPSNLLIRTLEDGTEQVKVVDFGLVKLTGTDQTITRAGLIIGSPHCMAPEQIRGMAVDHRADVYSVGILLFRCLTGQYPFHGPNSAATMIAHLNQPVPTFFSVAPDLVCPDGLEGIVRSCLAKEAADRPESMQELIDRLAVCFDIPADHFRSVSQTHSTIQRRSMAEARPGAVTLALGGTVVLLLGLVGIIVLVIVVYGLPRLDAASVGTQSPPVEAVVSPEPEHVEEAAPEPEPVEEAAPEPEPEKAAAPAKPKPKPKPEPVAEAEPAPPAAEPVEAKEEEKKPEDVDGYMGLPEDLF